MSNIDTTTNIKRVRSNSWRVNSNGGIGQRLLFLLTLSFLFTLSSANTLVSNGVSSSISSQHRVAGPMSVSDIPMRRPANAKKKAAENLAGLLKKKGKIVGSRNSIRGLSLSQGQNLIANGAIIRLTAKCWKLKVNRTSARIIFAKDKKTVLWAGDDHGKYMKKIKELCH